jgi:spermidine synthase
VRPSFEELDAAETTMGMLSLRRRIEPMRQVEVVEVKLGEEYLMSSLFTVAEVELARLGLAAVEDDGTGLHVVVGGLGLGYTALAALEDARVHRLTVVEALAPVIDWHRRELVPDAVGLAADPRTQLVHGDLFALVAGDDDLAEDAPAAGYHAILVDIDHSPRHVLHPSHAGFYGADGARRLAAHLRPGGVFALWSDDPPDDAYLEVLGEVFAEITAHVVAFPNVHTGGESANTVYVAR